MHLLMKIILGTALIGCCSCNQKDSSLRDKFLKPDLSYRMNINRHHIPDDSLKQDSLIEWVLQNGYGGIATNVSYKNYLRDNNMFVNFKRFVNKAKAEGLSLWLYDEKAYPSGMAGNYILEKHPEWEAEGLFFKIDTIKGKCNAQIHIPEGILLSCDAIPLQNEKLNYAQKTDISQYVQDNVLNWEAPQGIWVLISISRNVLYQGFQAGLEGGAKQHYPSLLMPEVTKEFLKLTHHKYAAAFDKPLGNFFVSTFTDEPSSMGVSFYDIGCGIYPWKEILSTEIKQKYGYNLDEKLLKLALDEDVEGEKLRFQYFETLSELISENYFHQIRNFCSTQHMYSGGHLLLEESIMTQVPLYGNIMSCYREMDIPGVDVLTGMPSFTKRYLYSTRLASSAAELEGKYRVFSEPCPVTDWGFYNGKEAPTAEVRGTLNRQIIGGVTDFCNYMEFVHENEEGKNQINEYVARITMMMAGGVRSSQVAVLYPAETAWIKYRPLPVWLSSWDNAVGGTPELRAVTHTFERISDVLYENQLEFSYIDMVGLESVNVHNGILQNGELKWKVLILPRIEVLTEKALRNIDDFIASGGTVIALEKLPIHLTNNFHSERVRDFIEKYQFNESVDKNAFFLPTGWNSEQVVNLIKSNTNQNIVIERGSDILVAQRKIGNEDRFFIVNDSPQKQTVKITIDTSKKIELWNPENGTIVEKNNIITCDIDGYKGLIIRTY